MRVIEVIVGVVILGSVSALAVPIYGNITASVNSSATRTALQQALSAQQQANLTDPDGLLVGTDQQLDEALKGVDFQVISDRLSGKDYVLAAADNGDIWIGDTTTGDTRQINDQIRTALDDAGIKPESVGGELGRLLETLNTGTLTPDQVTTIIQK